MGGSMKGSMGGCNRYSRKLFRRVCEQMNWYMFGTEGRFEASGSFGTSGSFETSGSFVDKLSISVTDLWEHAMFDMSSLWEKSDVIFWSGYQRESNGYEIDVQGCQGVLTC
ncbi:hypothetical protein Tco_1453581 [Tanacetum coccineum]